MNRIMYLIGWLLCCIYARLYHRFRVIGRAHIPPAGRGVLIASNHASYVDPIVVGLAFYRRIWYLARRTLYEQSRFANWVLRGINTIPISRERLDMTTLRQVQIICARGEQVVIFPEGTRSPDGKLQPGHAGVGLFADKIGADIVPVYVHGTFEAFSRHHTWPRPVRITVVFGPVLPLSAYAGMPRGRERYQAIADDIMHAIAALRAQLVDPSRDGA